MLNKNDIVQITNQEHNWFPCLIIVDKVKSWGIQGYIILPTNDDKPNGSAYTRLKTEDYEPIENNAAHFAAP